jgi:hypothetical protein
VCRDGILPFIYSDDMNLRYCACPATDTESTFRANSTELASFCISDTAVLTTYAVGYSGCTLTVPCNGTMYFPGNVNGSGACPPGESAPEYPVCVTKAENDWCKHTDGHTYYTLTDYVISPSWTGDVTGIVSQRAATPDDLDDWSGVRSAMETVLDAAVRVNSTVWCTDGETTRGWLPYGLVRVVEVTGSEVVPTNATAAAYPPRNFYPSGGRFQYLTMLPEIGPPSVVAVYRNATTVLEVTSNVSFQLLETSSEAGCTTVPTVLIYNDQTECRFVCARIYRTTVPATVLIDTAQEYTECTSNSLYIWIQHRALIGMIHTGMWQEGATTVGLHPGTYGWNPTLNLTGTTISCRHLAVGYCSPVLAYYPTYESLYCGDGLPTGLAALWRDLGIYGLGSHHTCTTATTPLGRLIPRVVSSTGSMGGVTQQAIDALFWEIMGTPLAACIGNRTVEIGDNSTLVLGMVWVDGLGQVGCTGLDGCSTVPLDQCSSVVGCILQSAPGTTTGGPTPFPGYPTFPPSVPFTSHLTDVETRQFDIGMMYLGGSLLIAVVLLVWTMARRKRWCRKRRVKRSDIEMP